MFLVCLTLFLVTSNMISDKNFIAVWTLDYLLPYYTYLFSVAAFHLFIYIIYIYRQTDRQTDRQKDR